VLLTCVANAQDTLVQPHIHIQENFQRLENGGWNEVDETIAELEQNQTLQAEIEAADFIDWRFKGFGPKQSRNLLQGIGLTKYEIPIDSRITK
jgi:hypothetical protein